MKSNILYTILALVFISNIQAQSNYDSLLLAKADSLIYYYSRYGSFTENDRSISKQYIKNFSNLFTDNATLHNDILIDIYSEDLLNVEEYAKSTGEKFPSGITISINRKEYGKVNSFAENSTGTIEVKTEKEVLGMTVDDEFFEEKFNISFIISFNLDLTNFKIIGIRKSRVENKAITLTILKAEDGSLIEEVKMNLSYNNEIQQTRTSDDEGLLTFTEIPPNSRVIVSIDESENFIMEKDKEWIIETWIDTLPGQRQILLSRVKEWTKFSLEMFGTPSLTHIKTTNTTTNYTLGSVTNDSEFGYGLGIGVSYALFYNRKIAVSIATGVGLDIYNSNIVFNDYTQNKLNKTDSEGDDFELNVLSKELTDELTLTYLTIPLQINFRTYFDISFIDYLFINAGVEFGYLMDNSSQITGSSTFYGFYNKVNDDLVNVNIHNVDDLGFVDNTSIVQKREMDKLSQINLSAIASVGISFPIVKNILNLDVAVDVNYGFSDISDYDYEGYYFAKDGFNKSYSSLVGSGSSISTQSFGVRIGLTYNIYK